MTYLQTATTNSSENCNWNDRVQEILNRPVPSVSSKDIPKNKKSSPMEGRRKKLVYQRRHSVEVSCPTCPFKSANVDVHKVREIIFNCNGKPPTKDMLHMTNVLYEQQREASDGSASSYESSRCSVPTVVDTKGLLDESYVSTLSTPSVLIPLFMHADMVDQISSKPLTTSCSLRQVFSFSSIMLLMHFPELRAISSSCSPV